MSKYTPITGELRAAMRQWGWVESDGSITFASSSMPPSIDAEKSLAIIGSDFDRMCDAIDAVHAQLERENEALKAELDRVLGEDEHDGWVRLPVDADGVPWHVGDVNENGRTITTMCLTAHGWHFSNIQNDIDPSIHRHHQPDTWESIIYDAMQAGRTDAAVDVTPLIERCKALCERTKEAGE